MNREKAPVHKGEAPASTAERVKKLRQKSAKEGHKRMELWLRPESVEALERLAKQSGESRTAVINRLILETLD